MKDFHKEENLQAAIMTVELVRGMHPKGKGRKRKDYSTRNELKKLKPSDLLVRGGDEEDEEDEDNTAAPPEDALEL